MRSRSLRLLSLTTPFLCVQDVAAHAWSGQHNGCTVQVFNSGAIALTTDWGKHELALNIPVGNLVGVALLDAAAPASGWRGDAAPLILCDQPVKTVTRRDGVRFEYDLSPKCPVKVTCDLAFSARPGGATLKRTVTLTPTAPPLTRDLLLSIGNSLAPSPGACKVFIPRQDGIGEEQPVLTGGTDGGTGGSQWSWPLCGEAPPVGDPQHRLAIPLISMTSPDLPVRLTHIADPLFATGFRVGRRGARPGEILCIYPCSKVPMTAPQTRTVYSVIHPGGPEEAMKAWYETALSDVTPGPDWLHDVAWQHYDYMSHGGKGWFEDIDALEKFVPREDRPKIVFALHGWYDLLGRYTYDRAKNQLDDAWTAFPNAPAMKDKFPTSESLPMSKAEVHRRIKYAKDRGLRVVLYFADGLAACEGAKVFAEDKVLQWGGWQGPDTTGRSYYQNPVHPDVYTWFVAYIEALLREYAKEIDGLVWDETFMVRVGVLAPGPSAPVGYPGRDMMRLTRELTRLTRSYGRNLAFLASDCIGVSDNGQNPWLDVPPYAIMTHGTYQDSHSDPFAWPYGLFSNQRNVLWSCNWQAVTRFDYTKFGVEHYDTPVATSNGWLDDKGIARLSEAEREAVLKLFNQRKTHRQQIRWLTGPPPQFGK